MKKWILAFALALAISGCATPRQRLATAEVSMNSTCRALIAVRVAGYLTDAEWAEVQRMVRVASAFLDNVHGLVLAGEDSTAALRAFNVVLDRLIAEEAKAIKRREGG